MYTLTIWRCVRHSDWSENLANACKYLYKGRFECVDRNRVNRYLFNGIFFPEMQTSKNVPSTRLTFGLSHVCASHRFTSYAFIFTFCEIPFLLVLSLRFFFLFYSVCRRINGRAAFHGTIVKNQFTSNLHNIGPITECQTNFVFLVSSVWQRIELLYGTE